MNIGFIEIAQESRHTERLWSSLEIALHGHKVQLIQTAFADIQCPPVSRLSICNYVTWLTHQR